MMFHREARLPIDAELMPRQETEDEIGVEEYMEAMLKKCNDLKPIASRNIKKAQAYQKKYYDKRRTPQARKLIKLAMNVKI